MGTSGRINVIMMQIVYHRDKRACVCDPKFISVFNAI